MRRHHPAIRFGGLCVLCVVLTSCTGAPDAIEVPGIDTQQAAMGALEQYDQNGNGSLSKDELKSCRALIGAFAKYDKDKDGEISAEELSNRFASWAESGVGISSLTCKIERGGRPLSGATVKLVPEKYLSQWVQEAKGTTDDRGVVKLAIDTEHLPDDMKTFAGVQLGLFKIEITHPNTAIPSKYNTETTLGREVTHDNPETYFTISL